MTSARILIVEDEMLVAAELEASLEDYGYQSVGIAPDANAALSLAGQKPDLALVDINLRDGKTGPMIAERLAREHGVTVLYLTANPRMAMETRTPGVVGVLDKPCQQELLAAAVGFALASRYGALCDTPPPGLTMLN